MKKTGIASSAVSTASHKLLDQPKKCANFWLCAILVAVIAASLMSRDIGRPFYGLHSWGQAHFAWLARSHVVYGLGYTKGFDTFAVGHPPAQEPELYLNHPIFSTLLDAAAMKILGVNVWALRVTHALLTVAALLIFMKIVRHLVNDSAALLAGLFFAIFPITAYFGTYNAWLYPIVFSAFWFYLVLIGAFKDPPPVKKYHKWALAICLFLALQVTWEGFFWALAIGIHYVVRCLRHRRWPEKGLLLILIIAPLSSLVLDFVILASGGGWDFKRLFDLAKLRATSGEVAQLSWSNWFMWFKLHAYTNFSLPVLIVALVYLTIGQLYALMSVPKDQQPLRTARTFPQFWLFLMPPLFQLVIMKGTLAPHQYWERPLVPLLAIALALGIMTLYDLLKRLHRLVAIAGSLIVGFVLFASCIYGTNYYFAMRWYPPELVKMFEFLHDQIPPDKQLLSFEPFIVDQFPGLKAASYRPEAAWYLDREIVPAGRLLEFNRNGNPSINPAKAIEDILEKAKTGKFPYYLVPIQYYVENPQTGLAEPVANMSVFISELQKRYKVLTTFPSVQGTYKNAPWTGSPPRLYTNGMLPYAVFDLTAKPGQ